MTAEDLVARGRASYDAHAWTEAFDAFASADRLVPLGVADLEPYGVVAQLIGRDDDAEAAWERAHHLALRDGDPVGAARFAFRLGMMLAVRGETARGGSWLGRATRLVEDGSIDCVERGYVLVPVALQRLDEGDPAGALEVFGRVAAVAERFADPDLSALGRLGRGRALIDLSDVAGGVALLDDAMLSVTTGEVSPIIVGTVYCASIEAFLAIYDLGRAQEWTDALVAWCEAQPDLVPYRGRCMVYRSELLRLHGAWPEAIREAQRAQEALSRPPPEAAVGEAYYQQAELHRLRGELAAAEAAYREGARWGRRPEPGIARLRLAQGQLDLAAGTIRRAITEAPDPFTRASLLDAHVDIALAAGDVEGARAASDALAGIVAAIDAPLPTAIAGRADGAVRLAEGDAQEALAVLRRAEATWTDVDAPYEVARVRSLIAVALRELGDDDMAMLELDAARRTFELLRAGPDLASLDARWGRAPSRPDGLSKREVEVLRLVAAGLTNRAIATELGISERTVDRHVSNLYTKLDVSSRSAATAYAYEHDLH